MWPYVSFCKAYNLQHDSFFHIYDYDSLVSSRTSYHTETPVFTHCTLQFFEICRIDRWLWSLHNHKACIFQSGIHLYNYEDSKLLFSFHKFLHKNVPQGHDLIQD